MSNNDENENPMQRLHQLHDVLRQVVGIKAKVDEAIDTIITTVVIFLHPDTPPLAREAICKRFAKQHPHATIATCEAELGRLLPVKNAKVFLYDNDGDQLKASELDITPFLIRAQHESGQPLDSLPFVIYKATDVAPDVNSESMFREALNRPDTGRKEESDLRELLDSLNLDKPFDLGTTGDD